MCVCISCAKDNYWQTLFCYENSSVGETNTNIVIKDTDWSRYNNYDISTK